MQNLGIRKNGHEARGMNKQRNKETEAILNVVVLGCHDTSTGKQTNYDESSHSYIRGTGPGTRDRARKRGCRVMLASTSMCTWAYKNAILPDALVQINKPWRHRYVYSLKPSIKQRDFVQFLELYTA